MRRLESESDAGDLPNFKFIEINGMRLTEPNQLYVHLWKALDGSKVTTEHAKNLLAKRFTTPCTKKKNEVIVVLVDELDLLWNRKQSVLYNIFEWPNSAHAKLVVLAIANTMDLPVSKYSDNKTYFHFFRKKIDMISRILENEQWSKIFIIFSCKRNIYLKPNLIVNGTL